MKKNWKKYYLNNLGFLFSARETIREKKFKSFKSRLFLMKTVDKISTYEPTPNLKQNQLSTRNLN